MLMLDNMLIFTQKEEYHFDYKEFEKDLSGALLHGRPPMSINMSPDKSALKKSW